MRRPQSPRHRRLVALVAVAFVLGFVASPGAAAQSGEQPDLDQFGGIIASARGNGIQLGYAAPGLLATGDQIFQLSVPEALATLSSGPTGYALASFAFPGPLVADLGSALAAGGTETGIPPYPIRTQAFFPAGPVEEAMGDQGTEMRSVTSFGDSLAASSFSGLDVNPAVFIGAITATSQTVVEGDQLVSRNRTEVSDVSILAGLVTIESIVTDIVATSNGTESASAGGTTATGVSVLGLPATIGTDGVRFVESPQRPPADDPTGGALNPLLGPVQGALEQAGDPLNALLDQVDAAGDDALQQLFEASGIGIRLVEPIETIDEGTAERTSSGLSFTIDYDGANTPVITDLLNLVPAELLPAENLGPIPLSPQALFNLFKRQSIIGFEIATANVSAAATPAFEFEDPDFTPTPPVDSPVSGTSGSTSGSTSSGGSSSGGGATATPELPAPAAPTQVVSTVPASTDNPFPLGDAIPVLVVLAVLLGSPFLGAGTSRLADNTLAATVRSCPDGLDVPPEEIGS